jgi:hypothetical protein
MSWEPLARQQNPAAAPKSGSLLAVEPLLEEEEVLHGAEPPLAARSSYTVHMRLRRNERLAIERLRQTDARDCQEPLLQKGSKRTLSVPSTLRTDGIRMRGRREQRRQSCRHQSKTLPKGRKHSERRLESNAGSTSQWHLKLY